MKRTKLLLPGFILLITHLAYSSEKQPAGHLLDEGSISEHHDPSVDNLFMAVFLNDVDSFKKLLKQGHDVNDSDLQNIKVLNHASALGELEIIALILQEGYDVNTRCGKSQSTAAHSAVKFGQLDALKILVENGANLSLEDANGKTPGQIAEEYEFDDIVKYIRSAESEHILNANTPLL